MRSRKSKTTEGAASREADVDAPRGEMKKSVDYVTAANASASSEKSKKMIATEKQANISK